VCAVLPFKSVSAATPLLAHTRCGIEARVKRFISALSRNDLPEIEK